jgi:C-terminal processing protease CtpA/Prc
MRRIAAALLAAFLLAGCSLPFVPGPPPQATLAPTTAPDATPAPAAADVPADATPAPAAQQNAQPGGVELITGDFSYTNDFVFTYYVENAVALVDMRGFVTRDRDYEIPVEGQTLGFMDLDNDALRGTFRLQLPARPEAPLSDVDNDGGQDQGVQVFAVAWWPNFSGGPFSEGDDRSTGWPGYLASVQVDPEREDEVVSGKLVVWSPDDAQQFPTGFGADGLLFTDDDPAGPIPAGYSVVNLDAEPFGVSRQAEEALTLYEPQDVAIKDLSDLSYTDAFNQMVDRLSREYAFNGIPGKELDYERLREELGPRVAEAERRGDARALYLALRDFTLAFPDGHVSLNGGDIGTQVLISEIAGGYGFAVRELTDGRFLVVFVLRNGPAANAGMQVGATLDRFGGQATADAVAAVRPAETFSTEHARRYAQANYLTRAPQGATTDVTFTNPGGQPATATLTAVREFESFFATSLFGGEESLLPVEFRLLDSGVGYIKISSNYDDLNLLVRLYQRALRTFAERDVPGVVIDLRQNSGGQPLGLASYLTDQEIVVGQGEAYSDATGKFEPRGDDRNLEPAEEPFSFDRVAVLVGPACASACEFEAFAYSQLPNVTVVGHFPTAGIYADVARGMYRLPEGMSAQFSASRTVAPDGSLIIEGQGVPPDVVVPVTAEGLLSDADEELDQAERVAAGG